MRARASMVTALLALGAPLGCRSHQRLSRGDAAVVVATPVATSGALQEQEPNGPGSPMPLALGPGAGLSLLGALAEEDDEDGFVVQILPLGVDALPPSDAAPAPSLLLALEVVPGDALAATIAVVDVAGRPLGRSSAGPGQSQGLPNLAVAPGQVVRVVLHRSGRKALAVGPGAGYRLSARLVDKGAADEIEPNENAAQATLTGPAHTAPELAGFLGGHDDSDWFRVPIGEAGEGTVLAVEVEPPPEVAPLVAVADAAGNRLVARKGRKGQVVRLRQLAPAALAAGAKPGEPPAFYVSLHAEGAGDRERRYLLRILSEDGSGGEREPNDDPARATPFGEGPLQGYLPPGDVDHFRVDARRGQAFTLTLTPPRRLALVLEALLPGQTRWVRADAGRRGQPETLSLTPEADGAVLLRVTSKRAERDVEGDDEPYRLELQPGAAPPAHSP